MPHVWDKWFTANQVVGYHTLWHHVLCPNCYHQSLLSYWSLLILASSALCQAASSETLTSVCVLARCLLGKDLFSFYYKIRSWYHLWSFLVEYRRFLEPHLHHLWPAWDLTATCITPFCQELNSFVFGSLAENQLRSTPDRSMLNLWSALTEGRWQGKWAWRLGKRAQVCCVKWLAQRKPSWRQTSKPRFIPVNQSHEVYHGIFQSQFYIIIMRMESFMVSPLLVHCPTLFSAPPSCFQSYAVAPRLWFSSVGKKCKQPDSHLIGKEDRTQGVHLIASPSTGVNLHCAQVLAPSEPQFWRRELPLPIKDTIWTQKLWHTHRQISGLLMEKYASPSCFYPIY